MADQTTGREKAHADAEAAARVVLAKHPAVIPSSYPEPSPKVAAPRPADVGVRNIARSLATRDGLQY